MKRKLIPVRGAIVAGLVGAAYAACYWEVTFTCADGDVDLVDQIQFENGFVDVYADYDWIAPNVTQTPLVGFGRAGYTEPVCFGPAKFQNPLTSGNETISWWEAGIGNPNLKSSFLGKKPDPITQTCSF